MDSNRCAKFYLRTFPGFLDKLVETEQQQHVPSYLFLMLLSCHFHLSKPMPWPRPREQGPTLFVRKPDRVCSLDREVYRYSLLPE